MVLDAAGPNPEVAFHEVGEHRAVAREARARDRAGDEQRRLTGSRDLKEIPAERREEPLTVRMPDDGADAADARARPDVDAASLDGVRVVLPETVPVGRTDLECALLTPFTLVLDCVTAPVQAVLYGWEDDDC